MFNGEQEVQSTVLFVAIYLLLSNKVQRTVISRK